MLLNVKGIETKTIYTPKSTNHPFNSTLSIAEESFKSQGYNIFTSRGIQNVYEDNVAYEQYKDLMYGDITNESVKDLLGSLLDKNRNTVLRDEEIVAENGVAANVTQFAYLNGPILRAIWARSIVQAVMKVVPLKNTKYSLTFDIPYVIKNGIRINLPYSIVDEEDPIIELNKLIPKVEASTQIADINNSGTLTDRIGADGEIRLINNASVGNLLDESLNDSTSKPHTMYDGRHVDARISIRHLKYIDALSNTVTLPNRLTPGDFQGKAGDVAFKHDFIIGTEPVTFVCFIDLTTGNYRAMSTSSRIKSFKFDAYLSSEDNRTPITLTSEQHSLNIHIGTGQHVHVDTPVELLQDYPTSHQGLDVVVSMNDVASELFSGNMNVEMLKFFKESLINPTATYIDNSVLRGMNIPRTEFSLRVAHGENPSAYINSQLKKCISYYINKIRSYTRIEDGFWTMIGHANNMMHLPDFKYVGYSSINGDGDEERGDVFGFKVGFTFGFTTNVINGTVRCIYTPEMKLETGIVSVFTSLDERRPTYMFYVYSYTVTRGYNNPHSDGLVPSIMITKRHAFQEFVPHQFRLYLIGNDESQFTDPTTPLTPTSYSPGIGGSSIPETEV